MAKSPDKRAKGGEDPAVDLYKLKPQAVEDLVTADETNAPPVSKAELERYGGRKKAGAPTWLKVSFIKWWFPGSIFFFLGNGTGLKENSEVLTLALGLAMGVVSDLLTDNAIRFMAPTDGEYDKFLMFARKRYMTFVYNIFYALIISFVVMYGCYSVATRVFPNLPPDPIGFGLFYMLCDMLFLGVKRLIKKAINGPKNKNVQEG